MAHESLLWHIVNWGEQLTGYATTIIVSGDILLNPCQFTYIVVFPVDIMYMPIKVFELEFKSVTCLAYLKITCLRQALLFNLLWTNNAIWLYRVGSTLIQVMACCLPVPSQLVSKLFLSRIRLKIIGLKLLVLLREVDVLVMGWPLQWRHNGLDGVSDHQPHHCLLGRLFGLRSKKTSKLRVTGLCAGNSPGTGEFPAQMASNAENVSIWWRHHASVIQHRRDPINTQTFNYKFAESFKWFSPR